jgi:hypothetical protein
MCAVGIELLSKMDAENSTSSKFITDLSNSLSGPSGKISSMPERPRRTLDAKKGSSVTFSTNTRKTFPSKNIRKLEKIRKY